ncbi:FixH family protein [Brevibacillus ruminantium]|uniref:FixH family protein n=1 Tax=Brevibacillus ruminantium TaxID=2950604 RepID=A0ABY4WAZ8_9BACL|nr:FixH family protein [Brevibacillus ruminantium]USG63944.1 FixH family protein [Brevibacillus ruminantium]
MKRYMLTVLGSLALLLGAGCSQQQAALSSGAPIEVALTIEPQEVLVNEAATFSIKVTQDGAAVDDAKETDFEIWKEGQEQHEKISAAHQSDGVYTAQKSFAEPGTYNVMYHVTARDFHNMQKHTFTVKAAGEQADGAHEENHSHEHATQPDGQSTAHGDGSTHEGGEHEHGQGVEMHFQPADSIQPNQATTLTVHLLQENQALTEATVRFEIWREGEEKHAFIDTAEAKPGEYTSTNATFPAAGSYSVKVHVEKGEIHDHNVFTVDVK